ncbi:MAG: DUF4340 domain-containing protein [Treponema sp.]|nr:DUF4340 domain-containing protein [Treponema sp.]
MPYRKKLIFLLSLIGALSLIFTASLIFNPQSSGARSALYVWLDSKPALRISQIVISGAAEKTELVKINDRWFVTYNGREYPARQLRVDDFIAVFTARAAWPVRSTSASSHARLGLENGTGTRVTLYGENTSLLDLLFGSQNGREINVRRYGQNEVRYTDSSAASYITSPVRSWFNLRLIPESEDGRIAVDSVQRLSVYTTVAHLAGAAHPAGAASIVFSRRNREWTVSGAQITNPDQNSIDSYIRSVLNAEGEDFNTEMSADSPVLTHSRIVLELGDGSVRTIRLSEPDESGKCFAHVTGSDFIYSLSSWTAGRLFRNFAEFEKQ